MSSGPPPLEIELTIDDPNAYTRPWTVTLTHLLMADTELLDYHCSVLPGAKPSGNNKPLPSADECRAALGRS